MKLREITNLQAEQELQYKYKSLNPDWEKVIFVGIVGGRFFYLQSDQIKECDVSYALENFELK